MLGTEVKKDDPTSKFKVLVDAQNAAQERKTAREEKQENLKVAQTAAQKEKTAAQEEKTAAQMKEQHKLEVAKTNEALYTLNKRFGETQKHVLSTLENNQKYQTGVKEAKKLLEEREKRIQELQEIEKLKKARGIEGTTEEEKRLMLELENINEKINVKIIELKQSAIGDKDAMEVLDKVSKLQNEFNQIISNMIKLNFFDAPERGFLLDQQMFERSYPAIAKWIMTEYLSGKTTDEILKTIDERRELLMESVEKVQNGGELSEEERNRIIKEKLRSLFIVYYCSTENVQGKTLTVLQNLGLVGKNGNLDSQSIPVLLERQA